MNNKVNWTPKEVKILKDCYPDLVKAYKLMNGKHSLSSMLAYASGLNLKGQVRQKKTKWQDSYVLALIHSWGNDDNLIETFPHHTYQSLRSKAIRLGLTKKEKNG